MYTRKTQPLYNKEYDLHNCNQEPIKLIRRLQSYATLIVLTVDYDKWCFATEDVIEDLISHGIGHLLPSEELARIKLLPHGHSMSISIRDTAKRLIKHELRGLIYLEIEEIQQEDIDLEAYQMSILRISDNLEFSELLDLVLQEIREITGYDHTMIYQFDENYHGVVIKENKTEERPSYLGLKFPSSDIPEQARKLYFSETIRTIANVKSEQLAIFQNPEGGDEMELNLESIHSRGVSPIHLEYLSNINVEASFSVAIIYNDRLWGLIACHHTRPNLINYDTRKWLKFLSKLISINLGKVINKNTENEKLLNQINRKNLLNKILDTKDLVKSIVDDSDEVATLMGASGIVVKSGSQIETTGEHINLKQFKRIFKWLGEIDEFDVLHTSKSKAILPEHAYSKEHSGLLIIQLSKLSQDYIVFVRPEEKKEVLWAGNPNGAKSFNEDEGRLSPRKSFEKWKGVLEDTAKQWSEIEIEAAHQIKIELREFLYKKYNELILVNKELKQAYQNMESFSYTVSHDLKAPLRSIDGFAKILVDNYAEKLDEHGLKLLNMMVENVSKMNTFIKDILQYSKLNNNRLSLSYINTKELILDVWNSLAPDTTQGRLEIKANNLPKIYGDRVLLRQVFQNLFSNSLKYVQADTPAHIIVQSFEVEGYATFSILDNGIGIPKGKERYVFDAFRRFVPEEEFEGTGIGLAIVKKVVERHNGEITVDDQYKKGAKFDLKLPTDKANIRMEK